MIKTEKEREDYFKKLIKLSVEDVYDPISYFDWSEKIDDNCLWMSPELLSFYNTPYFNNLSKESLYKLTKQEITNFFSMSINGEKNIKMDMLKYLNSKYFKEESEYFIHFLGEENKHIYFFSKFCTLYSEKIFQYNNIVFNSFEYYEIDRFIVFIQTLIAEEIGDFYNVFMAKDMRLPKIIREINHRHHLDESRHIGMGRKLCKSIWQELSLTLDKEKIYEIQEYLKKYILNFFNDFYNINIYLDGDVVDPYDFRLDLIQNDSRKEFHIKVASKLLKYLRTNQMISGELYNIK